MDLAQQVDRNVSKRLHELRVSKGLSQQQLADMIGVTYQQAHKYEKGINRISVGRLALIADAMNVPIAYFFKNDAAPNPDEDDMGRISLEAARKFREIHPQYQQAMYDLIRAIAEHSQEIEEA